MPNSPKFHLCRPEDRKMKERKDGETLIRLRLAHQVRFGESVAIAGSAKELGSWRKEVGMQWTEDGWVCEVRFRGGQTVEFKFIVLSGGNENLVWENGSNRVLEIPSGGGVYDVVCRWDRTDEVVELAGSEEGGEGGEELGESGGGGGRGVLEGELSPFVEQWQGREASFMRSNEHGGRESERRWDTSGLEGVPLRVVEGDRTARNWWRKVYLLFVSFITITCSIIINIVL